jgi:hypothetical protein
MTVTYEGVSFTCPDWALYIAADGDGSVHAFERKPHRNEGPATHYWKIVGGFRFKTAYVGMLSPGPYELQRITEDQQIV